METTAEIIKRCSYDVPKGKYAPQQRIYHFNEKDFDLFCKTFKQEIINHGKELDQGS